MHPSLNCLVYNWKSFVISGIECSLTSSFPSTSFLSLDLFSCHFDIGEKRVWKLMGFATWFWHNTQWQPTLPRSTQRKPNGLNQNFNFSSHMLCPMFICFIFHHFCIKHSQFSKQTFVAFEFMWFFHKSFDSFCDEQRSSVFVLALVRAQAKRNCIAFVKTCSDVKIWFCFGDSLVHGKTSSWKRSDRRVMKNSMSDRQVCIGSLSSAPIICFCRGGAIAVTCGFGTSDVHIECWVRRVRTSKSQVTFVGKDLETASWHLTKSGNDCIRWPKDLSLATWFAERRYVTFSLYLEVSYNLVTVKCIRGDEWRSFRPNVILRCLLFVITDTHHQHRHVDWVSRLSKRSNKQIVRTRSNPKRYHNSRRRKPLRPSSRLSLIVSE